VKLQGRESSQIKERSERDSEILGLRLNNIEQEMRVGSSASKSSRRQETKNQSKSMTEKKDTGRESSFISRQKSDITVKSEAIPQTPTQNNSTKKRPPSAKSRPQTGSKAKNSQGQGSQSRSTSRQGSRPTSRATSRAASRLEK